MECISLEIKLDIKIVYKYVSNKNFLYFLRESEWKIKTKKITFQEKLDDFIEMFNFLKFIKGEEIFNPAFLNNEDLNKKFNINKEEEIDY